MRRCVWQAKAPALLSCLLAVAQQTPVFRAQSNLVIVNVSVRGRDGQPVRGLTKSDFEVLEDGKPQVISIFEFQQIDATPLPALAEAKAETPAQAPAPLESGAARFRDRRLLVLFFDLASMQPPEQLRAVQAGEKFLREQMAAGDLVSIVSFGASLRTDQEFTPDRAALLAALRKFRIGESSQADADTDTESDDSDLAAFSPDETEFNVFNTDSKLSALEQQAAALAAIPEKKAIVYFSSGVARTGAENESQLRSTINAAVRANVSFYPVDVRGLVALPPGGGAAQSSPGGSQLFSGRAQVRQRERLNSEQETLDTLAASTGGKALLDTNDIVAGIRQAQRDIDTYYTIGYYSTNLQRDGRRRRIEVRLTNKLAAKLDYRKSYYADKEFKDFNAADRERQLEDALLLGDPVVDLPVAVEVNWFRAEGDRFFVPLAVKIPGSAVPLRKKGSAETTEFDFVGEVRDAKGARAAMVRDAIRIRLRDADAGTLASHNLVYDTGFTLAAGEYRVKLLVRENQTGKMGTFEMPFRIPGDPGGPKLHLSSVVWSGQREPVKEAVGTADKRVERAQKLHPLVSNGEKLIPSVTRVFRQSQTLYVYAEAYDPGVVERPDLRATLSFFHGAQKALETQPVAVRELLPSRRRTAAIRFQVPLAKLPPGTYTAQLTVIDSQARKFAFTRAPIVLLAAKR